MMEVLSGTTVKGRMMQLLTVHHHHGGPFFLNGKGSSIKPNLHPPKLLHLKGNKISHYKNHPGRNFQLRVTCLDHYLTNEINENAVPNASVSVILLSGGKGKRMGASMPKQYLPLLGQPIALYSFFTFCEISEVKEIIVVCDSTYRDIFQGAHKRNPLVTMKFASPGKERQDSVFNGLKEIDIEAKLVCVHDSARPLVRKEDIKNVLKSGRIHGAAVLGVPVKATIKEAGKDGFVTKTLDRSLLWEMQTPQVIEPSLLRKGFELVQEKNLAVTDDVSIVEHLKHPVFIMEGSYTNIKITTPDDMLVAENILNQSYEDLASVVV